MSGLHTSTKAESPSYHLFFTEALGIPSKLLPPALLFKSVIWGQLETGKRRHMRAK